MDGATVMQEFNLRMFDKSVLSAQEREEYYSTHAPILMPNSSLRQYRLLLAKGVMVTLKVRICKPEDLTKFLVRFKPIACYQTISCWSNPELLTNNGNPHNGGYKLLSNLFLYSDYLLDIDEHDCTKDNLERIDKYTKPFERTIVRTGTGYHVWLHNWMDDFYSSSPYNREKHAHREMEKLTDYFKGNGLSFDFSVSEDTRRIARVPNTLHQNGRVCKILDEFGY